MSVLKNTELGQWADFAAALGHPVAAGIKMYGGCSSGIATCPDS